ncbi:TPA: hypothetical protein N0F65_000029 [Lagenidium giganteum]|uniref:Uncharacterized protein n=1 Tax=Lagenidium giganteum TaxID=4803 RepID=A0AAV2YS25_9STRA|nr:TPA: hypothetical protein N0F65_000029 [Lagenidium giganteum]
MADATAEGHETEGNEPLLEDLLDYAYAESTEAHAAAALKKFNAFLQTQYPAIGDASNITKQNLDRKLMGRFATYLIKDAKIGYNTSSTYLSSVKQHQEDKLQTDFFERNNSWYSRLRTSLRSQYMKSAAATGSRLQDKAPPMMLSDLKHICNSLFLKNTTKRLRDRTLVASQWSMVRRSSDVSTIRFDDMY